jgi:hypothetical protein
MKFCVLITLSQGLTLLIFKSTACTDNNIIRAMEESMGGLDIYKNTCEWDKGSSMNVSAIVLWFLTGLCMIVMGPPSRVDYGEPRDDSKEPPTQSAAAADLAASGEKKDDADAEAGEKNDNDYAEAAGEKPEAVTD